MKQLDTEKAEHMLGALKCGKGFTCIRRGVEVLCKATDIGVEGSLEWLEGDKSCIFSIPFGSCLSCKCPIRIYIKKELGK